MATFFRTKVVTDIGTTPVDILSTGASRFTIIGMNLANTTDYDVIIDITVTNENDDVTGYFIKQLMIPPYTAAKAITNGEKLIIADNCKFTLVSDTPNSVDAVVSYAEIV